MTVLPDFVGPYKILKKLGQGGFATVYLAQKAHEETEPVALKALIAPESYARFQREIETVAGLDHPNIIRIFDTGEFEKTVTLTSDNGTGEEREKKEHPSDSPNRLARIWHNFGWGEASGDTNPVPNVTTTEQRRASMPYFTMAYIAGGTLRDQLEARGRLTRDEALFFVKQIGAALTYAHEQGIIHRDVNPNNILLDTDQHPARPILTDFGMVKPLAPDEDNLTVTLGLIGTFHYYAPEQWGKTTLTPATDLYALAITFFEMLSGRRPFQGDIFTLRDKHLNDPIPPLSSVSPQIGPFFDEALFKATAKDPAERHQSIEAFIADLEKANQTAFYDDKYREVRWLIDQEEYAVALDHLDTIFIRPGEYYYRDVARLFWGLVHTQQHQGAFPTEWQREPEIKTKPFPETETEQTPALPPPPLPPPARPDRLNQYIIPLAIGAAMLVGAAIATQLPVEIKTPAWSLGAFGVLVVTLSYYTWVYYLAPAGKEKPANTDDSTADSKDDSKENSKDDSTADSKDDSNSNEENATQEGEN